VLLWEKIVTLLLIENNCPIRNYIILELRIMRGQSVDTLTNLKAFLGVARTGSFAAAARELEVAPSVVTKRISQIEWRLKTPLFERTTRRVSLTPTGQHYLPLVQRVVADADGLFADIHASAQSLQGIIRIKVPGSLAVILLGQSLNQFQAQHPLIQLEVLALDRTVNPVEEGFDIAITLMPHTFGGVIEQPLCAMPRMVCAAPGYLARRGSPVHPRELVQHDILNFLPTGNSWEFNGPSGKVNVDLHPRFSSNEAQLLLQAALAENGIAILSAYMAQPAIESGHLIALLKDFPMADGWVKALIPESRIRVARVQALLQWLTNQLGAQE
jgi:DNA-binding transcriptional LysR family regulator